MAITTYTRAAKCGDCKFCKSFYDGKKKKQTCGNVNSKMYTSIISLKDLVCDVWEISN